MNKIARGFVERCVRLIELTILMRWLFFPKTVVNFMAATDEWDYKVVENLFQIDDLHEIILRLMVVGHEKLTYHFSG